MESLCLSRGWSFGPLDLSLADLENPPVQPPTGTGSALNVATSPDLIERKKWLFEKRFNYGVEFFKFHADRRMKMFQFFLIFVGLVAGAYATLLTKGYVVGSSLLGFFAGVLTICFLFLEHRNEELVHIAEDVLASLESDALFAGYFRPIPWPRRRNWLGWMGPKPLTSRPVGIFRREAADIYGKFRDQTDWVTAYGNCSRNPNKQSRSRYEHGKWLPWVERGIFVLFILLTVLPWLPPTETICGHTIHLKVEAEK